MRAWPRFAARVLMSAPLTVGAAAVMAACPPAAGDGTRLASGPVQMAWRVVGSMAGSEPDIAVGRHFAIEIQLCPADARLTKVDASMPAHRHGMNYRPSLTALGDGRYRAEGLMFHMAGDWQLRFDADLAGQRLSLSDGVSLR